MHDVEIGNGFKVSASQPPNVEWESDGRGGLRALDPTFFLRSTEVPGRFGAPISGALQVEAELTPPGGAPIVLSESVELTREDRKLPQPVTTSSTGVVGYRPSEKTYPSTMMVLRDQAIADGPAGVWSVRLQVTDENGNTGNLTSSISK